MGKEWITIQGRLWVRKPVKNLADEEPKFGADRDDEFVADATHGTPSIDHNALSAEVTAPVENRFQVVRRCCIAILKPRDAILVFEIGYILDEKFLRVIADGNDHAGAIMPGKRARNGRANVRGLELRKIGESLVEGFDLSTPGPLKFVRLRFRRFRPEFNGIARS